MFKPNDSHTHPEREIIRQMTTTVELSMVLTSATQSGLNTDLGDRWEAIISHFV